MLIFDPNFGSRDRYSDKHASLFQSSSLFATIISGHKAQISWLFC